MTEEQLAALEALAASATPGPWVVNYDCEIWSDGDMVDVSTDVFHKADAAFVAAARDAVPELIAEVRRLRELLKRSRRYMGHDLECDSLPEDTTCECGYLLVLADVERCI